MTRKEQNKILDDKIKANNAQYNSNRMNAEISAYSSGDLHKYKYLTKKDLGYKPDAFEKAEFEYSPLGKVFTNGLNKSDKYEGLLKRLKNIESKSNNQLLALRDINRPAIRGRDDDDDDDNDDISKEYKKIVEDYRNNKIEYEENKEKLNKAIDAIKIHKKNKQMFENIPNIESKMNKNEKFVKMLKKVLNEIITNKIYKKSSTKKKIIDITWVDDPNIFNQINNYVAKRYHKDRDSTELLSIQNFLEDINNEDITSKDDARKEFIKLKKKIKSDELKDIVKELERSIFGYEELPGSGLKILTNKQMLNRLPILLAQIQAENNSSKLKNEARQILYSLYRSKELTKTVYTNLIKAIRR